MLNRHILRIKAMQSLYSFEHVKKACLQQAVESVQEEFSPLMKVTDELTPEILKTKQKIAGAALIAKVNEEAYEYPEETEDIQDAVSNETDAYYTTIEKERKRIRKDMLSEPEKLPGLCLSFMRLLVELQKKRVEKESNKSIAPSNFSQNSFIEKLQDSDKVKNLKSGFKINWPKESSQVYQWLKELIEPHDEFKKYQALQNPDFENDKNISAYILKKIVLKNKDCNLFFEEKDLSWSENKNVIRSMINRVVKETEEESDVIPDPIITVNWEDDKGFFKDIFDLTVKNEEKFEHYITKNSKNWDIERIAQVDRIILRMALTELVHFPTIPVKVTINEYIEISKKYSTTKSKQFVNGMLDAISEELDREGMIRKSGRGLIDNK